MTATSTQPQPAKLGPYEVGAKIAGGGMATVYIGRKTDDRGQEQLVALKVIKDELANDQTFIHMFFDEAKILSRLSHPNIIETLEYGVTDEHRFIAMELLLGRSLMDVWELLAAKKERVPVALGAWICARVADGLAHAHTLKDEDGQPLFVIHRDVNPSNIFLAFDGRVKLIDFGLAKMRNQRAKTGEGIVKGKVPYLSPEQIMQDEVDGRSDLYSLGTTLWELGAGKRLFKRDSDIATIDAIRQAVVPDIRQTFADYPDALWDVVRKSLQPKPEDRYATAADMARDLDAYVDKSGAEAGVRSLEKFLSEVFSGDQARQTAWLRAAKSKPVRGETMPPPMPLPEVKRGAGEGASAGHVPAAPPVPKISTAASSEPPKKPARPPSLPAASARSRFDPVAEADRRLWLYAALAFVAALALLALTR